MAGDNPVAFKTVPIIAVIITNNRGRTDRSFAAKLDLNREFQTAVISLALSAGRAKAREKRHGRKFHKAEMMLAGTIGDLNLVDRCPAMDPQDAADTLISPLRPKLRQDVGSLKLRYPPRRFRRPAARPLSSCDLTARRQYRQPPP